MAKIFSFTSLLLLLLINNLFAQEAIWSLDKCIQYGLQNSIAVKQAELEVENIRLTERQAKMELIPNLNADISGGFSYGRTIDPITNSFQSQSIGTNSLSLGASYTLYNGGRIKNTIKQGEIDLAVQRAEVEVMENNISLNIAQAYINILIGEEQLQNAFKRLDLTKEQLSQTDRLIKSGVLPQNDRLVILAQIAEDEQQVILQSNNVDIGYLNLKNILMLEEDFALEIVKPDHHVISKELLISGLDFKSIYNQALQNQPIVRSGMLRKESAQNAVSIANAGSLPRVMLFGNIRTDYANSVLDFTNPDMEGASSVLGESQLVNIDGQDVAFSAYQLQGVKYPNRTYFDQLDDNFGQSIGLSVTIPIYNNDRNKTNVQKAKLNIIRAELTDKQNKQEIKTRIQNAIANLKAAKQQLEASEKSLQAFENSYQNIAKKFKLGAANTFDFTSAKNDFERAKFDLTIAKFDFLYKGVILDFYRGKKIKF